MSVVLPLAVGALFGGLPVAASAATPGVNGRIAFASYAAPKTSKGAPTSVLTSVGVDGAGAQQLFSKRKTVIDNPEYSPDGTKVAFTLGAYGDESKRDGIYVAAADGSGAKQVVRTSWTDGIAWSPDGQTIAYTDLMDGLHVVPSTGGQEKLIVEVLSDGGFFRRPTFTPDGASILFERDTLSNNADGEEPTLKIAELWKAGVDGSGAGKLFAKPPVKFASEPDVSPDGKTLLFDGPADKYGTRYSLYTMPLDGSAAARKLYTTKKRAWIDGATWSPDGTRIALSVPTERSGSSILLVDPTSAATTELQRSSKKILTEPTWQALPAG